MALKSKRKLSHKARRLVQGIAHGLSQKDAAIQAGYSSKNPRQSAHQALKALARTMPELMDEAGLTDRALIYKYLLPLLRATRTKHFQYKGKVRDTRKEKALEIRRDALELALRIKGSFAPIKTEEKSSKAVSVIVLDVPRPPREHPPDTVIEIASESEPSDAAPKQARQPELERTRVEVKPPTNNDSKH